MNFYDPLYGRIEIAPPYQALVNSAWFRRLQNLRQLGLCYLSFPGGNHSRFEHSIGAGFLASTLSTPIFRSTALSSQRERERLLHLIKLALLCHDIGHGPFSHMTENVLHGLGAHVTHEEVGAAIVTHKLTNELIEFADKWGITPSILGSIITKTATADPLAGAATTMVSSELDLDRLDYLHRDSHYSGLWSHASAQSILPDVFALKRFGEQLHFELTEEGLRYAETILFMRRNNYQRIVFETRHMAATAMFEKAVLCASRVGAFKEDLDAFLACEFDWKDAASVDRSFAVVWKIYGLVDHSLLALLRGAAGSSQYLAQRILRGQLHESVVRYQWSGLHYLAKQSVARLRSDKAAFNLRRSLEQTFAQGVGIDATHIAVHVPKLPGTRPIVLGVAGGQTFETRSPLGQFLEQDALQQYAIEIFVNPETDPQSREKVVKISNEIFLDGSLPMEPSHAD